MKKVDMKLEQVNRKYKVNVKSEEEPAELTSEASQSKRNLYINSVKEILSETSLQFLLNPFRTKRLLIKTHV